MLVQLLDVGAVICIEEGVCIPFTGLNTAIAAEQSKASRH